MKKETCLFLLVALFLSFSVEAAAQNKSYITVLGSELNNNVLVVDIVKAAKSFRLQCNWGASSCTALKDGKYVMVELPENFGMYECKCVEVYPESAVDPQKDKDKKIGEYCLVEK